MLSRVILSSRRRHTRWPRDWSSDVCSSDLIDSRARCLPSALNAGAESWYLPEVSARPIGSASSVSEIISRRSCQGRSEERRVGKGGRGGWRRGEDQRSAAARAQLVRQSTAG